MYTHWSDVMGNELSANEVMQDWRAHRNGLSLAAWLEQLSREMWGSDHRNEDWSKMAQEIMRDGAKEIVRDVERTA